MVERITVEVSIAEPIARVWQGILGNFKRHVEATTPG